MEDFLFRNFLLFMFISSLKLAISIESTSFLLPFCKKERKPRRDTFSFVEKSTVPKSFPLRSHSVVKITENSMIQLGNSISSQQVLSLSLSLFSLSSSFNDSRGEEGRCSSNKYAQAAARERKATSNHHFSLHRRRLKG